VKCEECGKEYKTRSGLRRHVKSVHAGGAPAAEVATKDEAGPTVEERIVSEGYAETLVDACEDLGIHPDNIMSYKVYDDKVVIIEGPTGWKRVWRRE